MDSPKPEVPGTKAKHFLGIARLDIELDFQHALKQNHREESTKATNRLLQIFSLEGCRRFGEENFIDALVDTMSLNLALADAHLSRDSFKSVSLGALCDPAKMPTLPALRSVNCLNGLQRIRAAAGYLPKNDRWWFVRLHSSEGCHDTSCSTRIIESFAHENVFSDGTIFRNILKYQESLDSDSEDRWWARLTYSKRKDLRQLLNDRKKNSRKMIEAFKRLVQFPGLWPPIQLGTLHRLHGLKYPEVNGPEVPG
jgi:hypothetical protein